MVGLSYNCMIIIIAYQAYFNFRSLLTKLYRLGLKYMYVGREYISRQKP